MTATHLTAREDEVRGLVADGLTNDEIASRLHISSRTVEAHLRMLFRKTGASRREQLMTVRGPADGRDTYVIGAPADEEEIRRLEEKLAERDRQVQSYEAAVERIIDRQFPLFDERVEITVTIGSHTGEDMVVERHWTTPNPYLVYRVVRPITAAGLSLDAALGSLALTCEVAGADVGVAVQVVADRKNRPLALILFQPGLEQPAEWVLRYRTPGLWDPLRESGEDTLTWAPGTLDGRHSDGIRELAVRFLFPPESGPATLEERNGAGLIEEGPSSTGGRQFSFRDLSRTGGRYEWILRMIGEH